MNQQELNKILDAHEMWLEDNTKGKRADLSDLDLRGLDFSGRILSRIILRGAACTNADFTRSNLIGADCTNADFTRARLRNADCAEANFTGARLRNADCIYADFNGATLTKTLLAGANLTNAKLPTPIIQIGGIGSRQDYTVYHVADNLVQCGCWNKRSGGSLEEFAKRVDEVYPETSTEPDALKYRSEYLAAIEFFKASRDIYLQPIEGEQSEIQARR